MDQRTIDDPGEAAAAARRRAAELARAGRVVEAARGYRDALRLDPEDAGAWASLGHLLRVAGRAEAAAGACRRAIRLAPGLGLAHTNLGAALLAAGRPGEALAAFARAREIAPEAAEPLGNLALARQRLGQHEAARELLERALARAPAETGLRRALAWSLMSLGCWEEACACLLAALETAAEAAGPPGTEVPPAAAPEPGLDAEACRRALLAAGAALDSLGTPFFLAYGTLLGLVREGGFIAHDSDIDLGIWRGAPKAAIVAALAARGFAREGPQTAPEDAINLAFRHEGGAVVELYEHWPAEGRMLSGFELGGARLLWAFTPFGLAERDWLDGRFLVPDDTERYLAEGYGDWRTPERHFDATFWAPNIVGGFPPIARAFACLRTLDRLEAGHRETALAHLGRIAALEPGTAAITALKARLEGSGIGDQTPEI